MAELIRSGNIKLVLCFAFYLAWWFVAFNPWRAIRGMASGWLLIPAAVLGAWALFDIVQGLVLVGGPVSGVAIAMGGVVAYVVLLGITRGLLHRTVTSELAIIVLWATVAVLEVNSLVALGSLSSGTGVVLALLCIVGATASIVCYVLFYQLDAFPAFVDGAIPLLVAFVLTGAIALLAVSG